MENHLGGGVELLNSSVFLSKRKKKLSQAFNCKKYYISCICTCLMSLVRAFLYLKQLIKCHE
jgi:hypothetical protein